MTPPPSPPTDSFPIKILESTRLKRGTACFRDGEILVKLPKRWPASYKKEAAQRLAERVKKSAVAEQAFLDAMAESVRDAEHVTFHTQTELEAYVRQINAETFQAPLRGVRIGKAKYSRLAQVNLKTRMMTVSQYCLNNVPASALRYLIVHELAHFLEGGHNQRFWGLVAQYVPDYPAQSRLMKAMHRRAVLEEGPPAQEPKPSPRSPKAPPKPQKPEGVLQTLLFNLSNLLPGKSSR